MAVSLCLWFCGLHIIRGMGFPMWTLIGMGVTAVLALLMTILAYIAQSPRALMRMGLAGYRLDLRVKLFTGYALASPARYVGLIGSQGKVRGILGAADSGAAWGELKPGTELPAPEALFPRLEMPGV